MTCPPSSIPEPIWRRLAEFLESGQSGRIWLDVKGPGRGRGRGQIVEAEFPERVKANDVIESAASSVSQ
jgi:hypothetical protein